MKEARLTSGAPFSYGYVNKEKSFGNKTAKRRSTAGGDKALRLGETAELPYVKKT